MLYEPPKTKKYVLIGAVAVILAVLVIVAVPLLYKDKTLQNPTANLPMTVEQQKIRKEQGKLIEITKKQRDAVLSTEEIQKEQNRLIEKAKASGAGKSPEELRKDTDNLIKAAKK